MNDLPPGLRWFTYGRVSSDDQLRGNSLEDQKQIGLRFVESVRGVLAGQFVDEGKSAFQDLEKRVEFRRMVEEALSGKCDAIAFMVVDRLSRNAIEGLQTYQRLTKSGIVLYFINENINTSDVYGYERFARGVVESEIYSRRLSERIKIAKHERAMRGGYNGHLPFGYDKEEVGKGRHGRLAYKIIVNEVEAASVRKAFEMSVQGYTHQRIAAELNIAGHRTRTSQPFTKDSVRDMLQNNFYIGIVKYKGETFKGNHPAIVDEKTFRLCRQAAERRRTIPSNAPGPSKVYPLSGLLYCAHCDTRFSGQAIANVRFYRDRAKDYFKECGDETMIVAEQLETQMVDIITQFTLPDDWRDYILEKLKTDEPTNSEERQRHIQERLRRLKNLYEMGDMTDDEYRTKRNALTLELDSLKPAQQKVADVRAAADLLNNFVSLYRTAQELERKMLFRHIIERALIAHPQNAPLRVTALQPATNFYPLFVASSGPDGIQPTYSKTIFMPNFQAGYPLKILPESYHN